jgi:hypothetical protein
VAHTTEFNTSIPLRDAEADVRERATDSRIKAGALPLDKLNNEKIRESHGGGNHTGGANWKPTKDHLKEQRACREALQIGEFRPHPMPLFKTLKEAEEHADRDNH